MTTAREPPDLLDAEDPVAILASLNERGDLDEHRLDGVLDLVQSAIHDRPRAAESITEFCETVALRNGLPGVRARAAYLRARILTERGELDTALMLVDAARAGWIEAGRPLNALRSDLGRMQVLDDLGRHRDAADVGHRLLAALSARAPAPDDDPVLLRWLRAAALDNTGVALSFMGEHERALAAYARAEHAYRDLDMPAELARPIANRGIELLALGRAREAAEVLGEARRILYEAGDRVWYATLASNLAQALLLLGDMAAALQELQQAAAMLDELGAAGEAVRVHRALAEAYLTVGLRDDAAAEAAAVVQRATEAGMRHDAALAMLTLGRAELAGHRLDDAAATLDGAAAEFEAVGDRQYLAHARLVLADVAAGRGDADHAATLAQQVADAARATGWTILLARAVLLLAALPSSGPSRRLDEAASVVRELQVPQLQYDWDLALARACRAGGDDAGTERALIHGIELAERWGADLPDPFARVSARAGMAEAHDQLVDLLARRGLAADVLHACEIADRAKAQTLRDLRAVTVRRRRVAGGPSETLEQLHVDLSATYSALNTDIEPTRRRLMNRRAEELERVIALERLRLATAAGQAASGPVDRLPALACRRTAHPTLAYHAVGNDVVAFVIADGHVAVRRLADVTPAVVGRLAELAVQWQRLRVDRASVRRHEAALAAATRDILQQLYDLVIAPVADLLEGVVDDELVVVPHRVLHQVPFHALHDGTRYLDQRWATTITPTIGTGPRAARLLDAHSRVALFAIPDDVPAVEMEADALRRLPLRARAFVRDEATVDRLVEEAPAAAVVHLACHGLYRPQNPMFSALRLADRWVTAAEITGLDLRDALVTLSACESGRADHTSAEPVGLAWAFLAAGARDAVVSQWLVDDVATAGFMTDFYRSLVARTPTTHALRAARLAAAEVRPHPFYWAPFSYVSAAGESFGESFGGPVWS